MSVKNNASARRRAGEHPLSHKIASVAASALLVWSMWPTGALAEVQKELTAAQEEAVEQTVEVEDDAQDVVDGQDSVQTTETTVEDEKTEEPAADADEQPAAAAADDVDAEQATEADIALEFVASTITYANQVIAAPTSKVTVPTADDFKFTAAANTGYELAEVSISVNGSDRKELDADANGTYTISAADIAQGVTLYVESEQPAGAATTNQVMAADVVDENTQIANEDDTTNSDVQTVDSVESNEDADQSDVANEPMAIDELALFDGTVTGNDTLEVGKFAPYVATGFSGAVTWTTSDSSIATVDSNGNLTGVAEGTVEVIATYGTEGAKKTVTVTKTQSTTGKYNATIVPTIENADVAYFAWHDTNDTSNIAFTKVSGAVTVNDYTTTSKPGYVVFFVKPNSNHIVTGLGASGNGDIYPVDATSWGNINSYPNIAAVMAAAKSAGYVAAFGWYRGARSSLSANFTISAKSPDMTVIAVSDRTDNVASGDELTFTVTITPKTTGSGKDKVSGVHVNSADVNGTAVEVENLTQNSDGTFTGTVHYTATDADCGRGKVVLTVNATSTYAGAYTISSGDLASTATVTKTATTTCKIAPDSDVQYEFVSGTSGKTLPGVINTYLPVDNAKYSAGKTVNAKNPSQTVYEDTDNDGYWTFGGWDKDSKKTDRSGGGVTFTGTWTFTQYSKYTIKYVDTDGNQIADSKTVSGNKVGDVIKKAAVEHPEINGYSYSKTTPDKLTINSDESQNVVSVIYKKKAGKAGYYLVLGNATWSAPSDTTKESDAQKWYYNYGFAKGDTFEVTGSVPSAENHVFIGWMDKERDDQAAAIRKAGDTVTYCYSNNQTYTLDALWASLSAAGDDVTYDGAAHGLTVDVSINEGTGLKDEYVKQAKGLITEGAVEYSTDGGNTWSPTAPTYTDAGEYPVKVKQDITVGGVTTTLTAETTIKIAPKTYYVKTNTASKEYDGTQLVGTATVEGLIEGESATATATTIGPDVTASTSNAVIGEIAWGENTKSSNYVRGDDQLGTLEITKKDASKYEASVSIDGWTYDGLFDSKNTLTSSNNAGNEQATYTYYKKNGSEWELLSAAPVNAGDYKVVATWAATTNYPELFAQKEFTISKAAIEVKGNFTTEYTGQKQTKYIYAEDGKQVEGVTVNGVVAGETLKLWDCPISGTDAGVYTKSNDDLNGYQWSVAKSGADSTDNYTITVSGTLTINKKGGLTLNATGYSGSYDAQSHEGIVDVNVTAGTTVEYSTDGGATWTADAPSITDVVRASDGSVSKVDVKVRAYNPNYTNNDAAHAVTAEYSLQVSPLTITVSDSATVTYNGQSQELELTAAKATGLLAGETLTLSDAKVTGTAASATPYTQVSNYTWSVAKAGGATDSTGNYNISVTGSLTINAKALANDMSANSPSDSVYDGNAHQWTNIEVKDGETTLTKGTDYTVTYKRGDDETTDFTSAGTITVVITGTGNYTGSITKTYEITRRPVTFTGKSDTKTYNGQAQTVEGYDANTGENAGLVSGHAATLEASASGILPGTYAGAITAADKVVIKSGDTDVTANYNITTVAGELTINKISTPITITAGSAEKVYDGTPLTTSEYSYTQDVLLDGDVLTAVVTGSKTDVGNDGVSSIASYKVMRGDTDVTSAFTFAESVNGNLTVTRRDVTITANSGTFTYDGTAKTVSGVKAEGLAAGQTTSLTASRTETAAGSYDVVVTDANGNAADKFAAVYDAAGNNVSTNYNITINNGTLTIEAKSIESDSMTVSDPTDVVYNGQEQKFAPVVKDGTKVLTAGTDYDVSYSADTTNVGTVTVTITGKGNYAGTVTKTYKITQAPLQVSTPGATKVYDGTPLTAAATADSLTGLVNGETAIVVANGSQTNVGSSENGYTITWGTAKESNYYIQSENKGTLTVNAKSIVPNPDEMGSITVNDPSNVTYDGQEHKWVPVVKDGEKTLVEGTDYEVSYGDRTDFTNVDGTITVTITGKGNYSGSFDRTYQINKAQLSVVTESASRTYNGEALTATGTINGFVNNETAAFSVTGSQTTVGNSTNWYQIDWTGTAKQGNYEISEELGTLTVTESENEVVVTTTGGTFTYDGLPHGATVSVTNLPAGYTAEATSNATATDANGEGITAAADNLVIKNTEGVDVTKNLKVTYNNGTIKIKPAELTVETYSAKQQYNGSALTAGGKISGFVGNETATLVTKGSQTVVGKSSNSYEISWDDNVKASNYTVAHETIGELEVTPNTATIYVVPAGASKVYDGTALEGKDAVATVTGVPNGFTSSYTLKGSQTDKGQSYVEVDTFKIFNAAGDDVTSNFSGINTESKGALTVTARPVTLTSGDASKVYDGQALVKHVAAASDATEKTGLVSGQAFDYEFSGSQIEKGSSSNTFVAKGSSTAKVSNYDITYVYGTLEVTEQSIVPGTDPQNPDPSYKGVTIDDPSNAKYDAQNHQWVPEVKDADGNTLIAGTDYTISYQRNGADTTDFKNVGTITVTITGAGNYTGSVTKEYRITKRQVTLTSDSGDKKYDGTAIQRHGVTVSGDGFATGENVSQNYTWYDSDFILPNTEGYVNQFDYVLKDGTLASNYEITKVYGNLKVYKASAEGNITLTVSDKVETYDGNAYTLPVATATVKYDNTAKIEYSLDGQTWVEDASSFSATNVADSKVVQVRASSANFEGYVYGTENLTINKRTINLTSESKVFTYTGEAQGWNQFTCDDSVFKAEVENLGCKATVTNVGDEAENTVSYDFKDGFSADNYNINKQFGKLTVAENSDQIVVTVTGGEFTYTGKSFGASVEVTGIPAGYKLDKAICTATATNVSDGEVKATCEQLVIRNAANEDVTSKLNIKYIDGTIKIKPAELTVTTNGGEKEYDGKALTADGSITGFVNGETAELVTTGSQTYVGESENTYDIKWGDTDKDNYTVSATLGILKVTEPTDNSKVITKTHADGTYGLGDTVTFTITATNIYSETKTLTIAEQEGVSLDKSVFENVAPGASATATATYTITEADILAGTFTNKATVSFSGTDKTYSAEDTVTVDEAAAKLTVTKTTTSEPANGSTYALGEQIAYDVKVTNTGNLTATDVVVEDQLAGATLAEGQSAEVGTLAPGASATVKYVYTVTEGDILAGKVVNSATASGKTDGGDPTVTPGTKEDETDTANGKISVTKTTTSEPADGKAYKLGETISYKIVVKNEGNLTVNNIKVNDANADGFDEQTIESLAPGASAEFDATHMVTEADIQAGKVENVATAKGTDSSDKEADSKGTDTEPTDTPDAALTVTKTAEQNGSAADGAFKLGETINYSITVKNTGNQTVKNITVTDPNADGFGEKTVESLEPGQSETFPATHKVTEADILAGTVVNTATAKGTDPTGKDVEGEGSDTKTIEDLNTTLTVEKTAAAPADGVAYKLGETINYTINVTNKGNVAYSNVNLDDDLTALHLSIDTLAVGETKTFTTSYVVTSADIINGVVKNVACAKGDEIVVPGSNGEETVRPSGEDTHEGETEDANAVITVVKTVTNSGTGENGTFKLGDTIEYGISVTNNGNVAVFDIQVVDPNADGFEPVTITELPVGATKTYTAKHVVTSNDILAGKVVNVATTTGGYTNDDNTKPNPTPGEVDTEVDALDTTLEVTKAAKAPVSGSYKLGETVEYTVAVTNKGNVPYYNVVVTDAQTGLNETIATLAVGESKTFTTTHVIDEADIVAGSYKNVATAKADSVKDPATGEDVTPSGEDSETIGGDSADKKIDEADPQLVVAKTSDVAEGTLLKEGDVVSYTVTVKNTGNLTLTNVVVTDQLAGAALAEGESSAIASLAPGASVALHYSYTVKQSDVVAGYVANTATATADNPSDKDTEVTPGEKTDPTEKAEPSLFVGKKADKTSGVAAGDVITYAITATNNGNVDLTGVVVTDELVGFTSEGFDLARGESKTFTQTYTVTEDDMVAGSVRNVAAATSNDPSGNVVPGSGETTTETEAIDGALSVVKTAAAGSYAAGDTVDYTITVTNTGNVTVYDIKVADSKTGLDETVTLAKGESRTYATSYVVTDEDVAAGTLENVATAKGTDPAGNDVEASGKETIDNSVQPDPDNPDEPTLKRTFTVADPDDVTYNGASQQQNPVVKDAATGDTLVEGVDYELTYSQDTTNAGTVTVTVTGKGNYTGAGAAAYQIVPATLTVTTPDASKTYDGQALLAAGSYSGLVKGETIGFATTGSQTMVGSSANTYSIEWADAGFLGLIGGNGYTAKRSNYAVVEKVGTLKVTDDVDDDVVVTKTHEAGTYGLGDTVTFTITATNIYDTAKTVTIGEIEGALLEQSVFENVQPGQTVTTTATYVIQEKDILAGEFTNTATASFSGVDKEFSTDDKTDVDAADPQLAVTKTSDVAADTLLKEGDVVNYTVTVKNTGNLTINNVNVADQLDGVVLAQGETTQIASLLPGESKDLHFSYTVKQSDVVAGYVANTATATADNPSDKDTEVTPGEKTDPTEKAEPSLFVGKKADKTSGVAAGDVITYAITATNNGNVDLTGVVVTDELVGFTSEGFDLARGESKTFTQTYTVTEDDMVAGSVRNVAAATSNDPSGNVVPGSGETTTETEAIDGALSVVKTAAAGSYAAGDTVDYTITVTNTGNVTVYDIKVADSKTGLDETVTLAKGESRTYATSYVVTDEDVAAGTLENVATAKGTDPAGNDVEASGKETIDNSVQPDPDNPDEPTLKRTFTVADPDDVTYNGASQQQNPVVKDAATGDTLVEGVDYELTYSQDTTNAGTVTVTVTGKGNYTGAGAAAYQIVPATLTVTTPDASKTYDGQALLAAGSYSGLVKGETIGFATTGSQTMVGSSANTYSIEWADAGFLGLIGGNGYTAKRSNYAVVEKVGTLKVTDDVDDDVVVTKTHEAGTYGLGDTVTFTITATNIYDTAKTVTIGEIEGALLEQSVFENVQPGQTVSTTATYVIQEKDILAGEFTNTATASFSGVDKEFSTDDKTDVDAADPQLTVTKTSDVAADTLLKEGDVVNYTVTVKNTGNLTINNVNVADQLDGVVLAQGETTQIASLLPGESKDLHFSYTVKQSDVVAGKVVNTATATGDNPVDPVDPTPVTPGTHEDHTEKAAPSFTIVKSDGGATSVKAGDVIDYTLTVVNNGNVDLTGVVVTDELTGLVSDAFDLARGESKVIRTSYVVTEADMVAGKVVNVATGTATDPSGNTVTGDEGRTDTTTEAVADDLVVEKTAAAGSYAAGDTVKYTIKVTNKGNVAVSGITVADAKTGFSQSDVTLAAGESREFYTTYVVTDADIAVGTVANRATADGTDAGGNPVHGEDTNTVDNHKQVDPTNPDEPTLKRTFTVENPEDVTYNGREQAEKPVVTDADGNTLVEGVDYELTYSEDTTNAGTVTVTVTGKGNYTGALDATYQIHPAVLTVTTGSVTKAYDGSALTSIELKLEGLMGSDYVVASTTGTQTEVGTSTNTYQIDWRGAKAGNYTIVEELGSLTVTEAVPTPAPTPMPDNNGGNTTPTDGGTTPAPAPVTPATPATTVDELPAPLDTVVEAMETVAETVTGEPASDGETIYDEANPLGATQNSCWVHFWMFVGMVVTAIYGLAVWLHRTNHTRKLRKNMNDLLGGNDNEGSKPVDVTNPAGMEA